MHRRRVRPLVDRPIASRLAQSGLALALALVLAGCVGEPAAPAAGADAPSTAADAGGAAAEPIVQLPQGNLEAVALDVGVALDADGRVAAVTDRVRPADAVHASLVTVGESEAAMLAIAWRDASGNEIDADERAITANGPAVHTFTRQPEGGWAPGRYDVEVRVDGESAGVRTFDVR